MKEMPLNKAFSDALRKLGEDRHLKNVAQQLEIIQQTVAEFHDAGIPVTLTVRPEKTGYPSTMGDNVDGIVLVNGTIDTGDAKLDFVIQKARYRDDKMELIICRDGRQLMDRVSEYDEDSRTWEDEKPEAEDSDGGWDPWGERQKKNWDIDDEGDDDEPYAPQKKEPEPDLKSKLSALIIELKAKGEFVAKYNVGLNGVSGTAIDKPFNVAPPLRLKKPEQP
ncbi:MAG: hypothetical protein ACAH83_14255 [Alphaproteobacteria bacterium]